MYFEQIIFPPKTKPIVKRIKDHFEFWFVTTSTNADNSKKIRLMVRCPSCDESFQLRESVPSETIMRFALRQNVDFYFGYVTTHCPRCHPNNPVDPNFLAKYNSSQIAG